MKMQISNLAKDGDIFTLNDVTYIYIGCDINGMDIYKLKKESSTPSCNNINL